MVTKAAEARGVVRAAEGLEGRGGTRVLAAGEVAKAAVVVAPGLEGKEAGPAAAVSSQPTGPAAAARVGQGLLRCNRARLVRSRIGKGGTGVAAAAASSLQPAQAAVAAATTGLQAAQVAVDPAASSLLRRSPARPARSPRAQAAAARAAHNHQLEQAAAVEAASTLRMERGAAETGGQYPL